MQTILVFPSLLELIDFEMVALEQDYFIVNRKAKTITAAFSPSEIEKALLHYRASLQEEVVLLG